MRALASGVPLIALPMGRDQDGSAVRIVHRGLGLRPGRSPQAIAAATQRVLTEASFRSTAQRMATQLREEVAAGRLLAELEQLVSSAEARAA
jgi:UDP:flavonoid glycosyltransferase YjiC (YdhE family)